MKRRRSAVLVLSLVASMGCAQDAVIARERDGATSDGASTRPDGALSATLVTGEFIASLERDEASGEDRGETRFALRASVAGRALTEARVTVESALGLVSLSSSGGQFTGSQRGYADAYTLVIAVNAEGAELRQVVRGPVAHRIELPMEGARVRASTALEVRWAPFGAAEASIETERMAETPVSDTGMFTVPAAALVGEVGRESEDRVRVRRTGVVVLDGAAAGSSVRVSVRRDARFVIEPR
jgi:hypothetical protein